MALSPQVVNCIQMHTDIKAHPLSNNPDRAWDMLQSKYKKEAVTPLPLDTPVYADKVSYSNFGKSIKYSLVKCDIVGTKVRFVCVSDTHNKFGSMTNPLPSGDVLLHAGDFTGMGGSEEVVKFSDFLQTLDDKYRYKVVIAGNHELSFDVNSCRSTS